MTHPHSEYVLRRIAALERELAEAQEHLRCAEDAQDYRLQAKALSTRSAIASNTDAAFIQAIEKAFDDLFNS